MQLKKNCGYRNRIKQIPFGAVSGTKEKLGLKTSPIPRELLNEVQAEEGLKRAVTCTENSFLYRMQ
jgi:hypothetical protein